MAVTWDHVTGTVLIYTNGKQVADEKYSPGTQFVTPTGKPYCIGSDGSGARYQFHGSVMDLYVFGTVLSLDDINRLRGERFTILPHLLITTKLDASVKASRLPVEHII